MQARRLVEAFERQVRAEDVKHAAETAQTLTGETPSIIVRHVLADGSRTPGYEWEEARLVSDSAQVVDIVTYTDETAPDPPPPQDTGEAPAPPAGDDAAGASRSDAEPRPATTPLPGARTPQGGPLDFSGCAVRERLAAFTTEPELVNRGPLVAIQLGEDPLFSDRPQGSRHSRPRVNTVETRLLSAEEYRALRRQQDEEAAYVRDEAADRGARERCRLTGLAHSDCPHCNGGTR